MANWSSCFNYVIIEQFDCASECVNQVLKGVSQGMSKGYFGLAMTADVGVQSCVDQGRIP